MQKAGLTSMNNTWSIYVVVLTLVSIAACLWLLLAVRKNTSEIEDGEPLTHEFDGINELNNPLPRWWLILYLLTIVFGVGYLILYPGFGNFSGTLGWSSQKQWQMEDERAKNTYGKIYAKFASQDMETLLKNERALAIGQKVYLNNCIACHGTDARGSRSYPNLRDSDWLYGNSPAQIKQSIAAGRNGNMPALGAVLGEEGTTAVIAYIKSFGEEAAEVLPELQQKGKDQFAMMCAACHGADAKGNVYVGAPNLTDDIWLHGGTEAALRKTIMEGRTGEMPAHGTLISKDKIHILAAYILSLSE